MSRVSGPLRLRVMERDGYRCVYCGRSSRDIALQVDHIKPVVAGGTSDPTNLVTACVDCNLGKSDRQVALPQHVVPVSVAVEPVWARPVRRPPARRPAAPALRPRPRPLLELPEWAE